MAIPNPNNDVNQWLNLGQFVPQINQWKGYSPFITHKGTLRLTAFSLTNNYDGRCYLRIRYNLSTPSYSKWIKYYGSPIPLLINPYIDSNFANIQKIIEVQDYRYPIQSAIPKPVQWLLKIDLLQ